MGAGLFGNCQTASDSQKDELRVSRSSAKSKGSAERPFDCFVLASRIESWNWPVKMESIVEHEISQSCLTEILFSGEER